MTKAVELTQKGEVAIITLNDLGQVEVSREGIGVVVMQPQHTFDSVVQKFVKSGWEVANVKEEEEIPMEFVEVSKSAKNQNIPVDVQQEVDAYLQLHAQVAELEKQMKKYKESIRSFMEENKVNSIKGTHGKQVCLQEAKASNSTSIYTDYELADIMAVIPDKALLKEITEIRVNAKKLEGLISLGKLPEEKVAEIKKLKIVKPGTPRFSVKK